jgi:predicted metalloprotease
VTVAVSEKARQSCPPADLRRIVRASIAQAIAVQTDAYLPEIEELVRQGTISLVQRDWTWGAVGEVAVRLDQDLNDPDKH